MDILFRKSQSYQYSVMRNYLILLIFSGRSSPLTYIWYRKRRLKIYREFTNERENALYGFIPVINKLQNPELFKATFRQEKIIRVDKFLADSSLKELKSECESNQTLSKHAYLPFHKKGGTLSYENIHRNAPVCLGVYHSTEIRDWLSEIVGETLHLTPEYDQSSCSILYYNRSGDHINWHFDHNFYQGRHFTVLISVENSAAAGGLSAGRLMRKRSQGASEVIETYEYTLVMFEGAKVLHRATQIKEGDTRIMLSMTFCTNPRIGFGKELIRRIKDTSYYGPRALID